MKKGVFILCLAICALFAVSSVCASDVNDTITTSDDTAEIIGEANDEEIVSSADEEAIASSENEDALSATPGTFTELQNKIDDAESNSTISLDKDYKYDSGFDIEGIRIFKHLTINGNGHTLDGLSKSRIFYLKDTEKTSNGATYKIVLNNIKFINGCGGGGAIYAYGTYKVATGYGMNYYRWTWDITINGCTFNNNAGGAIIDADDLFSGPNTITITNSVFSNNKGSDGGAICSQGHLTVTNTKFNNNKATENGGAIYKSGYEVNLNNCIFTSNSAINGAAIDLFTNDDYESYIQSCTFNSNKASEDGGAILVYSDATIKSSKFTGNTAGHDGGAIYFVSYSKSTSSMGNYYHSYHQQVLGSTFTNNAAGNAGGAIFSTVYDKPTVIAEKCTFTGNKAKSGNAVSNVKTSNCIIKNPAKTKLTLKTVKIKKSAKKLILKATLKKGNTPLKSKKITFKFNGKKYKAKTNKKGIAKVTIKKKILKKLKVGKKVKYQASYGKLTVKKTAKVKK